MDSVRREPVKEEVTAVKASPQSSSPDTTDSAADTTAATAAAAKEVENTLREEIDKLKGQNRILAYPIRFFVNRCV